MAVNYAVHMQFQSVTDDVCLNPLLDEPRPLVGVVRGPGVIPVGRGLRGLSFYARDPHDLLLENTESAETSSCGGSSLPVNCELDAFTTLAGVMAGVVMTNRTVTVRVRAKYSVRAGKPPPAFTSITVQYYHVALGGGETFLGSRAMTFLSTAWVNRSGTITVNSSWGAGEKFRVKYIGKMTSF